MKKRGLSSKLEAVINFAFQEVRKHSNAPTFINALSKYQQAIEPALMRYQLHHKSLDADTEHDLQTRFQVETATIHVITSLLCLQVKLEIGIKSISWPIKEADSYYDWFRLPAAIIEQVKQIAIETDDKLTPALLSHVSDAVLANLSKRYVGEFYTPLPIANHLIEVSGFRPDDLLQGRNLVDPACGGGIILSLIVDQTVAAFREQNITFEDALGILNKQVFGFDIQPFAVTMTRTLLIYSSLSLVTDGDCLISSSSFFPNVILTDPLKEQIQYWQASDKFYFIIGNPPYMSVKKETIDYIEKYGEVIYGHPNLYQLFLWWAVQSTVPGGIISLLVPQSLLIGNFLKNLRQALHSRVRFQHITRMIDRKGVVGDADQQMMVLCLKVESSDLGDNLIDVQITRNGSDISSVTPYQVKQSRVVQRLNESSVVWIVSDNVLDYTISEKVQEKSVQLADISGIRYGNGGFVWNQNKDVLHEFEQPSDIPLISSASIELYGLSFPYLGPHPSRTRQFSVVDTKVVEKIHVGPAILLQRVTPRKAGRRIVAGVTNQAFLKKYARYLLENHVNYIKVEEENDPVLLYGILGWLNCDVLNFIFQMRNGSSHLSVFELGLLPVDLDLLNGIAEHTIRLVNCTTADRTATIATLNDLVFDWFELGPRHRKRITNVLSRKERE